MRADTAPGGPFPDYELPDHTSVPRTLSELGVPHACLSVMGRSSCGPGHSNPAIDAPANRAPGSLELLTVQTGNIALDVGDHHVEIPTGDSAWFDATRPHAYANAGTTAATFTLVVLEPGSRRQLPPWESSRPAPGGLRCTWSLPRPSGFDAVRGFCHADAAGSSPANSIAQHQCLSQMGVRRC
jgi:hypothetical protein